MITVKSQMRVKSFLRYNNGADFGFALPLFGDVATNGCLYIQIPDETTNLVSGFARLDFGIKTYDLAPLDGPIVDIGSPIVHVFIDELGEIHCGDATTLSEKLLDFHKNNPDEKIICLQIAELIGDDEAKAKARSVIREVIQLDFDEATAKAFYEKSVLRAVLWEKLIAAANSSEAASKILAMRSSMGISISSDQVSIDKKTRSICENLVDIAQVETEIQIEFEKHLSRTKKTTKNAEVKNISISDINKIARQEERVALLLRALLRNNDHGASIISKYSSDKSAFANFVITWLKRNPIPPGADPRQLETKVASLIPTLYAKVFPQRRGLLLRFLFTHLSDSPRIRAEILKISKKTKSMYAQSEAKTILASSNQSRDEFPENSRNSFSSEQADVEARKELRLKPNELDLWEMVTKDVRKRK